MKKKAALLCRVSTPQQIEGGLESQVDVLKKKAIEDKYEVPDELVFEEQASGLDANKEIRTSLKNLMKCVEKGMVDAVYVYELTRISREPINLVNRVDWFSRHKVPIYIYDAEKWTLNKDTLEEDEETTKYVYGAATYGKIEAKKIIQRSKRGRDNKAKQGLYVGHLSDGYCVEIDGKNKVIRVDEERRGVIERIFDLFENGNSSDRIAEILNAEDVQTTNRYRVGSEKFKGYRETYYRKGSKVPQRRDDSRWSGSLISAILKNDWYRGVRSYKGYENLSVDRIITDAQWNKVQALIKERQKNFRSPKKSRKHLYLLSGLIYCGKCGRPLYGHYTGLNNHYFCSSVEEGQKCGTRGVCKENVEAIIADIIKTYAFIEVFNDTQNPVVDFFKLDKREEARIREDIDNNEKLIKSLQRRILKKREEYENAIKLSVQYYNDKERYNIYEEIITTAKEDIEKWENEIVSLMSANRLNEKKLKSDSNIKDLIRRIQSTDDLELLRELFKIALRKVTVFNLDASVTILDIEFVNGVKRDVIYSYRLLKNRYIQLIPPFTLDKERAMIICSTPPFVVFGRGREVCFGGASEEYYTGEPLEFVYGERQAFEDGEIPVRTFISLMGYSSMGREYERLEGLTDEAKAQDAKYKEWRKKYNTGNPSSLPKIVKDAKYETIKEERKRLYNRKYKTKKNKSLSEQEKQMELSKIDERLSLLSAQVMYLSRDEAIKEYKKNQEKV